MIRDVAIYGAGGLGRETVLMIQQINEVKRQFHIIGFIDDHKTPGLLIDGLPVLGGLDFLDNYHADISIVIAIAEGTLRERIVQSIKNPFVTYPSLIHPSVISPKFMTIGRGVIIAAGCILTVGIEIGNFAIVNLMCTIGHDVKIGDYTSLMPGCNVSGNVTIADFCLIGTGSKILQNLTIGSNCKVGAGAVVTRSYSSNLTLIGVPAKIHHE